jgi:hypothetical protein
MRLMAESPTRGQILTARVVIVLFIVLALAGIFSMGSSPTLSAFGVILSRGPAVR